MVCGVESGHGEKLINSKTVLERKHNSMGNCIQREKRKDTSEVPKMTSTFLAYSTG